MNCRVILISVISVLLVCPTAAVAIEPLQPVKPWLVDYDVAECHAEREYREDAGPVTLAIRPAPTGDTYELLIARKRPGPRYGEELEGTVDFSNGPIKAWLLNYGTRDPTLNILKFRISTPKIAEARSATSVTFHMGGHVVGSSDVTFSLHAMPDLLSGLGQCTELLRHYWNMTSSRAECGCDARPW